VAPPPRQKRGLSCAEIVQELARIEVGEDPTDPVNWLIRCAKVVDWEEEPEYGAQDMRAAVDTTIRWVKWTAVVGISGGMMIGMIIGALLL
jgi:hypothetical protein